MANYRFNRPTTLAIATAILATSPVLVPVLGAYEGVKTVVRERKDLAAEVRGVFAYAFEPIVDLYNRIVMFLAIQVLMVRDEANSARQAIRGYFTRLRATADCLRFEAAMLPYELRYALRWFGPTVRDFGRALIGR